MKYTVAYKKLKNESAYAVRLGKIKRSADGKKGELKKASGLVFDSGALSVRGRRAVIRELVAPSGFFGDDTLAYVDNGRLYYGAYEIPGANLLPGEKTLLKLGKRLMVFPDCVYADLDTGSFCGNMSAVLSDGAISAYPVGKALEKISYIAVSKEPSEATAGSYYAIADGKGGAEVKYFDGTVFTEITPRFKLCANGIDTLFTVGDVIRIRGLDGSEARAVRVLGKDTGAIICSGYLSEPVSSGISIERSIPLFDFAAVSGGRLVGVRRGRDRNGRLVSKIYASEEGNPFNFEVGFGGMELDVDISGTFTAVCDYLGAPMAFTESEIIETRVKNGALICTVIRTDGVESGAHKSIAIGNGELYYKSRRGICRYDGSYPEVISDAISPCFISESGSPGAFAYGKYYTVAKDGCGCSKICVFDPESESFFTEDDFGVRSFATRGANLYTIFENENERGLMLMDYDLASENERSYLTDGGFPRVEQDVAWNFETGEIIASDLGTVRPVKAVLRIHKPLEASVGVSVVYDGDEDGVQEEYLDCAISGAIQLPITLKRCDSFRIRVSGVGKCTVFGYAVHFKEGGQPKVWK